jgi:two-component system response regulator YesN
MQAKRSARRARRLYPYPFEREQALRQAVIAGDGERARQALARVVEALTAEDRGLERLQSDAVHLAVVVVRKCLQAGIDVGCLLAETARWTGAILEAREAAQVEAVLADLVDRLVAAARRQRARSRCRIAERARNYIDSNYQRNLTLQEVSRTTHVSYSYLSRVFAEETGMTFRQYLTRVRVAAAQELLRQARVSVEEAAGLVGYEDPGHFIRVFKSVVGVTPGRFARGGG